MSSPSRPDPAGAPPGPAGVAALGTLRFDDACRRVVDYLAAAVPLGYWAVNRLDGERQVYLQVRDTAYGARRGDSHEWGPSLCRQMISGAPSVAPDVAAVLAYAGSPLRAAIPVGAYVGVPLRTGAGELFGTLCGLDPSPQEGVLRDCAPLLGLLGSLLTAVLQTDLARLASEREAERAGRKAEADALTGLASRRGWDRVLAAEQRRLVELGEPSAVVVVDLDGLECVNDGDGHAAGDRLLRAAAALRVQVREHDVLARLGRDEFGLVATGLPPAGVPGLVARLRAGLAAAGVAASVGAAPARLTTGVPAAWEQADRAMYADKQRRRAVPVTRSGTASA